MWKKAQLKAKETAEFGTNNLRIRGSTNVRGLKRQEYCVVIDLGNFVTTKLSLLPMEGRQIFCSQEPTIQIDQILTEDLWESLDNVFTQQRNITFDRYTFLTRKQLKGDPVEKFYECLREL